MIHTAPCAMSHSSTGNFAAWCIFVVDKYGHCKKRVINASYSASLLVQGTDKWFKLKSKSPVPRRFPILPRYEKRV
ncbi:hypothetical protein M5K25_017929 [Dendrobium thyrsiflorum]|uniref:Uncharacterized protein n=1 Tax=Dendrobium thyrsiflorum TaxID=117978 RepID=A0ABD0UGV2_DENTH